MVHTTAPSYEYTKLDDRLLWIDGDSTVSESKAIDLINKGISPKHLVISEITENIKRYNQLVPPSEQLTIKQHIKSPDLHWIVPPRILHINIEQLVRLKFQEEIQNQQWKTNSIEIDIRVQRINQELALYKYYELYDVLKVLIYIINTLQEKKEVWGVGRGSSVSSYVLYILNVHDIDSVQFELDIHDFLPQINIGNSYVQKSKKC